MRTIFSPFLQQAPVPNPGRNAPAELTGKVDLVLGIAAWAGTAAGVAAPRMQTGTRMIPAATRIKTASMF